MDGGRVWYLGQRGIPPSAVGRRQLAQSQQSVGSLDSKLCPRDWYGPFLEAKEQPIMLGCESRGSSTTRVLLILGHPSCRLSVFNGKT